MPSRKKKLPKLTQPTEPGASRPNYLGLNWWPATPKTGVLQVDLDGQIAQGVNVVDINVKWAGGRHTFRIRK